MQYRVAMHTEFKIIEHVFKKYRLSDAELEVAAFLLKGASSSEIALARGTTVATVKFQITYIYKKTKSKNRAEFMAKFQPECLSLLLSQTETVNQSTSMAHQLFISSTTKRDINEIKQAWTKVISPELRPEASQKLLNLLLRELGLIST